MPAAAAVAAAVVGGLAGAAAADPVPIGLGPVADAYVSQQTPNKRYGTLPELRAAGTPVMRSYLRFDLGGVTGTVARATLRVYANGASEVGYDVRGVADTSWQEKTITYANAPPVASAVTASTGPFAAGWTSTDVTPLVSSGRLVSLALTSTAAVAITLGSRESANPPQLVLELTDTTAPAVTLAAPANGSWTSSTTPTFGGGAGTAAGDADTVFVRIYSGSSTAGALVETLSTSRSGSSWSVPASVPLSEGTYTAQAEQSDAAGNVGRSSANTFGVDTTAPAVGLTSPADGSLTEDATPALAGPAGTSPGDAATVTVAIYSGSGASGTPVETLSVGRSGDSWSVDASPALGNGTYTARAEQSDAAGNTGLSGASTFTVAAPPAPTPSYRDEVLRDGPGGFWRLGESSGSTAADETANGNTGSYVGGPALGRPGAVGADSNTSIALDGIDDTVGVPSSLVLGSSSAVSIECWIDVGALPSGASTLVRKDGQYLVRLTASGTIVFRLWKNGSIKEIQTPLGAIVLGAWHHVVSTWDGATMTVYVDGTPRVTGALAAPADVKSSGLYLGSSYSSYDWYAGRLDEVAVYGTALALARIQAHYATALALDTAAPDVSLPAPAGGSTTDARPSFGGAGGTAAGDAATVTVTVYSGTSASGAPLQVLTTARRAAGTFSVRAATSLPSGTYTAIAEQSDSAGNVGRSPSTTFTVDAQADPVLLAAGDIAACDTTGDEATASVLDRLAGTVATVGDHAYEYNTADDFTYCYDPTWGRHKARTMPTIGGHEYLTPNATPYFDYFGTAAGDPGKGYYSYDLGSWHVVSVNTNCSQIGGCGTDSPEAQWLRADLAAHPAACTLAVLHEPRFSSGAVHGNDPAMQPFWQALYDYGAELVLSGGDHVYERFAPQTPGGVLDPAGGVRQWVVGTGGRSHYGFGTIRPWSEVRNNDSFGVLALSLHATSYDWRFVVEAGKTFMDSGNTACH